MSKSFNRFSDEKAMSKAMKIAADYLSCESIGSEQILNRARRIKKNRAVCSCEMCRNPRTAKTTKGKEKLTIQERKHQKENQDDE